jgi:1-deoxy-D-xylulose-5-phosphate reductoisomerase
MTKSIALFGSTGSIGVNSLNIIRKNPEKFKIEVLVAHSNVELLANQALEFLPNYVCIIDKTKFEHLKTLLSTTSIKILVGEMEVHEIAKLKVDLTIMAIVGAAAIVPSINAIKAGNNIAMANKECLVCAGNIITQLAIKENVKIIPMDSEHTGLYQIFDFKQPTLVKDVVLTASGGPFREFSFEQMQQVTKLQALKHPNWSMGAKITIDSATLVNKCLEVIEACHLFSLKATQVKVLIHPESIVHALVNYQDGSVLAQLSVANMQIPISYALFYPERAVLSEFNNFNLSNIGKLHFYPPQPEKFKSLKLLETILLQIDSNAPLIFNMANEVAVAAFLNDQINFNQVIQIIETMLERINPKKLETLEEVLSEMELVRQMTSKYISTVSI